MPNQPLLLYPHNQSELDLDLFRSPAASYRGAPFWAWNGRLDRARLFRQIAVFKAMGMGGFHIHARTGLATEYLGDAFMTFVHDCVEEAQRQEMLVWLYDEDRYPSGFAGGIVTREPRYRAQYLRLVPHELPWGGPNERRLLGRWDVVLDHGFLAHYQMLEPEESAAGRGTPWYGYVERWAQATWYNGQTYVDTLSTSAIERFIDVTHERYAAHVGAYFGTVIPAIFSDEPQFTAIRPLAAPHAPSGAIIPWTDDLAASYQSAYATSLMERLPEVLWELPHGQASVTRYQFYDHIAERLAQAFGDSVGAWCEQHGIALTGHVMYEETLGRQAERVGEAMRQYRSFGLPGIDILCDAREYNNAKQAQSVAHQCGRPGMLSELYGITNWDWTFAGHKAQGDWQAALGVTTRVHHLAMYSMAGEAKRDYPASIGYQSPWHHAYRLIEDYFARLNVVLARGRRIVRVGVVHPIESYWLCAGPLSQTGDEREERERAFADLTEWLLFGQIDFDFIAESLLPPLCTDATEPVFAVGEAAYDVVVVPGLRTIRSSTLERLERFHEAGGTIVWVGEVPDLVDARPSERARTLAHRSLMVSWSRRRLLTALEPFRDVVVEQTSDRTRSMLYQLRADGARRSLFLANTDTAHARPHTSIAMRGAWSATVLDAMCGEHYRLAAEVRDGWTYCVWDFPAHGSVLLSFEPGWTAGGVEPCVPLREEVGRSHDPVPITLAEPNVLLLDIARYQLDDEPWLPPEEVLRIDTLLRQRLGFPPRWEEAAQPWSVQYDAPVHRLRLVFDLDITTTVEAPSLALENAAITTIWLDGGRVPSDVVGFFVDEAIQCVSLPPLVPGRHEIMLELPYGEGAEPEWCYLLGDFGVELYGRHARIVPAPRTLAFGDWTRQGLPFYAGNITYHCRFEARSERLVLQATKFAAPLLQVQLDGQSPELIAFAPFEIDLGEVQAGEHELDITVFGNRVNAFGALHNADDRTRWHSPNEWRTHGEAWSYEYQLKPMGLLSAPRLLRTIEPEPASVPIVHGIA